MTCQSAQKPGASTVTEARAAIIGVISAIQRALSWRIAASSAPSQNMPTGSSSIGIVFILRALEQTRQRPHGQHHQGDDHYRGQRIETRHAVDPRLGPDEQSDAAQYHGRDEQVTDQPVFHGPPPGTSIAASRNSGSGQKNSTMQPLAGIIMATSIGQGASE